MSEGINGLKFTGCQIYPIKSPKGALVASGTVYFNSVLAAKVLVYNGSKGLFATFCSEKYTDKQGEIKYSPYVKFVQEEGSSLNPQDALNTYVITAYNKRVNPNVDEDAAPSQPLDEDDIPF